LHGWHRRIRGQEQVDLAQPAAEPRVQLRRGSAASAASTAAAAAAAASTGDADVPGRFGDPGDEQLPAAASTAAAAAGRTRRTRSLILSI